MTELSRWVLRGVAAGRRGPGHCGLTIGGRARRPADQWRAAERRRGRRVAGAAHNGREMVPFSCTLAGSAHGSVATLTILHHNYHYNTLSYKLSLDI